MVEETLVILGRVNGPWGQTDDEESVELQGDEQLRQNLLHHEKKPFRIRPTITAKKIVRKQRSSRIQSKPRTEDNPGMSQMPGVMKTIRENPQRRQPNQLRHHRQHPKSAQHKAALTKAKKQSSDDWKEESEALLEGRTFILSNDGDDCDKGKTLSHRVFGCLACHAPSVSRLEGEHMMQQQQQQQRGRNYNAPRRQFGTTKGYDDVRHAAVMALYDANTMDDSLLDVTSLYLSSASSSDDEEIATALQYFRDDCSAADNSLNTYIYYD